MRDRKFKGGDLVTYEQKVLIPGYKVGPQFRGMTLVAPPTEKRKGKIIFVYHGKETMPIPSSATPLITLKQPNKFKPGEFELDYFEWKPQQLEIAGKYENQETKAT